MPLFTNSIISAAASTNIHLTSFIGFIGFTSLCKWFFFLIQVFQIPFKIVDCPWIIDLAKVKGFGFTGLYSRMSFIGFMLFQ